MASDLRQRMELLAVRWKQRINAGLSGSGKRSTYQRLLSELESAMLPGAAPAPVVAPATACVKCGHSDLYRVWMKARPEPEYIWTGNPDQDRSEHLRWVCRACQYAWHTPTADAAAPLPVETDATPGGYEHCRSACYADGVPCSCPAPAPLDDGGAASSARAIVHDAASVLGDHARESRTHLIGQDETLGVCDSPRTGCKPHWRTLCCTNWRALDDGETGVRECSSCGGRGWYPSPVWDSDVSCLVCGGTGLARVPSGTPGGGT
jgi:hypothetical protein